MECNVTTLAPKRITISAMAGPAPSF